MIGNQPKPPHSKPSICLKPACVHASSEILYNLSPEYKNIDPCTDFEELVCGGWGERHDLRPDQGDAFTGTIMSESSQMLLRHILEAQYPHESKVGTKWCPPYFCWLSNSHSSIRVFLLRCLLNLFLLSIRKISTN